MTSTDRASDLSRLINLHISAHGPVSLSTYMSLALGHPTLGYYRKSDPIGADGDFITAPEISQMFGEMIGIWIVQYWKNLGAPDKIHIVELGPGRGRLISDMLRILDRTPDMKHRFDLHLIEGNPVFVAMQKEATRGAPTYWHTEIDQLQQLSAPLLIVANEFFDALPVKQFQRADGQWHERMIGLDAGNRVWGLSPSPVPDDFFPDQARAASDNAIWESGFAGQRVAQQIAALLKSNGGAMLVIDYGYTNSQTGDTLQAVRQHKYVDPLVDPGNADLSSHVDFQSLAASACSGGAKVAKFMTQGDFLNAMGIQVRARALAGKNPDEAEPISRQLARLVDNDHMGALFKVACFYAGDDAPYPFETHNA